MELPPIGADGMRNFLTDEQDRTAWEPNWDSRTELQEDLCALAMDAAPRLFVVFQELGERLEVRMAAWGMEFAERAVVVPTDGSDTYHLNSADNVGRFFSHEPGEHRPPITAMVLRIRLPRRSACCSLQLSAG